MSRSKQLDHRVHNHLLQLIFAIVACASFAIPGIAQDASNESRLNVSYTNAGTNRDDVVAFVESYSVESEKREAAEFLVRNMPTVDLVSMSTIDMQENLEYAFKSREELPWVKELPFNLFCHYVLPHRVTQESFEPWRQALFDQIIPAIEGCDTMTEAAVAVNKWCGQRVGFKQTEFRDQNVMSTLRSGIGRCEEMMIVSIDAMRTAGIPARPCSAPWWVVNDNNHAWVEVWADGDWYYIGGCEPTAQLDQGWFSGAAQRAGTVISQMYGSPDDLPTGEIVCRSLDNMAYVNSTAVYAMTGEIEVEVLNNKGEPVADCPVSVSVFNFGALRALNTQDTDASGKTLLTVGLGEYFYAAGNDADGRSHQIIKTVPGEVTRVQWTLDPDDVPDASFWLRYPTQPEARRQAARRSKSSKGASTAIDFRPNLPAPGARDLYDPESDAAFEAKLESTEQAEAWRGILRDARENWRALASLVEQKNALELLQHTTKLDRLELSTATVLDHVHVATTARRDGITDEMFNTTVLNARIGREHVSAWRKQLADVLNFELTQSADPQEIAESICAWINEQTIKVSRNSRLGPTMNPGQFLMARGGTTAERSVFAVGALRTLGIPARLAKGDNRVEFHNGSDWVVFDPGDCDSFRVLGDDNPSDENDAVQTEQRGTIRLQLSRDDAIMDGKFYGYDVSTFRNGSWTALRNYETADTPEWRTITLPAGDYLVTAGVRNPNGDPFVRTQYVTLGAGRTIDIEWSMDLPADSGMFAFPIVHSLEGFPAVTIADRRAEHSLDLKEMVDEKPLLIFMFRMDDEPSIRMLPKVDEARFALEAAGVEIVGIALPGVDDRSLSSFLQANPVEFKIVEGSNELATAFGLEIAQPMGTVQPMPSVALFHRGGKPLMWIDGLNLDIQSLLVDASRLVR